MFKIFVISILLITSFIGCFGQNAFRDVSSIFRNSEHYFSSELNKKTIKLYLKEKQPSSEISNVLSQIENLKVVSFNTSDQDDISNFIRKVNDAFNIDDYTPFKIKTSGLNNQLIYLKEKNNHINNLIVINTNQSFITMVEIQGIIDLEKIALLQDALKINGLESLNNINNIPQKNTGTNHKDIKRSKRFQSDQEYSISDNFFLPYKMGGVSIYNRSGSKLISTSKKPSLLINGYLSDKDYQTTFSELNPECIQSINVSNNNNELQANGQIDVMLKGDINSVYTVCEGVLYFGQNGYLQSIIIDDDCGPLLLHNCDKKPLSKILEMEPDQFKSIELTSNPRNCEGILDGEYVVIK